MNLAYKDIKHTLGKFLITAMGVGMLLGVVLIMIGVYRGMIYDAKVLVNDINPDLWVVQEDKMGPFAESSKIHRDLKNYLKSVEGVDKTAAYTFQTIEFPLKTKFTKAMIVGYDVFGEMTPINPKRLIKGRNINKSHYEIVTTDKMKYKLGDKIKLQNDIYTVVGITHGTVDSGGNPIVYMSLSDANKIQFNYTNSIIRNDRARGIKANRDSDLVNTIVVQLKNGYSAELVGENIKKDFNKNFFTQKDELFFLSRHVIEKSSKQIGSFTVILIIVSTIIIGLIIYTMTLEKMKEIAIMKLIGIPNSKIVNMILQETVVLGVLAFISGNIFSHLIYNKFPKRVLLDLNDAEILFVIVLVASILSSLIGIYKVIKVNPQEAIGG
jgi:putative ABC transport system permease protein